MRTIGAVSGTVRGGAKEIIGSPSRAAAEEERIAEIRDKIEQFQRFQQRGAVRCRAQLGRSVRC